MKSKVIIVHEHHNEEIEVTKESNGTFSILVDSYTGDQALIHSITEVDMIRIRDAIDLVLRG